MKNEFFRANAGVVISDGKGQILACTRADVPGEAWQLPQGGIRHGEDPLHAALREAEEEVAIRAHQLDLVATHPCWVAYELPEGYRSTKTGRGQVQKWFLFRFLGDKNAVCPDGKELSQCRWMAPAELVALVAPFRKEVYETVLAWFAPFLSR